MQVKPNFQCFCNNSGIIIITKGKKKANPAQYMLAVCPLKWVKHQRRSGTAWESFGSHILQASKRRPSGESVWGELLPTLGSALARSRGATRPLEDGLVKACYQTLVSAGRRPGGGPGRRGGGAGAGAGRRRH